MDYINLFSILFGTVLGSLVTIIVQYFINKKIKKDEHDYEVKKTFYIKLSKLLKQFEVNDIDEQHLVNEIHTILGEAYMLAPDKVILGIKKIWEDKINDEYNMNTIAELLLNLRRDLIKNTKLKTGDFFSLSL